MARCDDLASRPDRWVNADGCLLLRGARLCQRDMIGRSSAENTQSLSKDWGLGKSGVTKRASSHRRD